MKKTSFVLLLMLASMTAKAGPVPHLDPEMTGEEYRSIFAALEKQQGYTNKNNSDPLNAILDLGKRNLDWIEAINRNRDNSHKLQLTTPETTSAYPIESPKISNRTIILNDLENLKKQMPKEMADVLLATGSLPDTNPIDDQTFIENARLMNRIYEAASRWLLQEPYLGSYTSFAKEDVRGYYFLNKEADLAKNLTNWKNLDATTQQKYSGWLIGECFNSADSYESCKNSLKTAISNNRVLDYHTKYVNTSKQVYDEFFELQNPRPEIIWNHKNPNLMEMPFTLPDRQDVEKWFKENVEDEFRMDNWALKIDYQRKPDLAKIEFEAGATPHVNGLGGDTITMDANRTLNEYAVAWTIRHEFGHVLGLPDCYIEFYDKENSVMVNYQLDITNLMCSRRGHLQTKHYDQLKKYYYKG